MQRISPKKTDRKHQRTAKEYDLLPLFEKFILDSKKGRRLQPNGNRISTGTITNYLSCYRVLEYFARTKKFKLRVRTVRRLNQREMNTEKTYWKKFRHQFSNHLYHDCGYFDNYVGMIFKNLKVFFNYLNREVSLGVGEFHKSFYVAKEEIAIFPLLPEELHFLIYDKSFEQTLTPRLREVKDFFVFGCTVALRFSDLVALRKENIRIVNGDYYLAVRSIKTNVDSLIKLPNYAVDILHRQSRRKRNLLPVFNIVNLNKYIKILLESAGFTNPVHITRNRRGDAVVLCNTGEIKYAGARRFCDVATTHTMRRTAITTMLSLGVNEQLVRKISGHSASGREFYRYVLWAQTYQDRETQQMFNKLASLKSSENTEIGENR